MLMNGTRSRVNEPSRSSCSSYPFLRRWRPTEPINGLLLRTDIHRLFDLGYVTVSHGLRFEVSHRLKADFDNRKYYSVLHGAPIRAPQRGDAPAAAALFWHRKCWYLG